MSDKLEEQMAMQLQGERKYLISTHCKGKLILEVDWNFLCFRANPAALNGKKGYNPGGKKSKVSSGN